MPEEITQRLSKLRIKAAYRYNITPEKCHIGHLVLEGMLEQPTVVCQIDAATNAQESNLSVATRSMRLASAMRKFGLSPGDPVVISGPNHLDLTIPFYSCHLMGYSSCTIDPSVILSDLKYLFTIIKPKLIVCQKDCVDKYREALEVNSLQSRIITFDDKSNDMETFIREYNGTEFRFEPATDFNPSKTIAWMMLTSGTTGLPKVALIPYDTLLNGIQEWWLLSGSDVIAMTMVLTSTQWVSSLIFFISTAIRPYTRLQCSQPVTPQLMVHMINTYKPHATGWTPYIMWRFIQAGSKVVDLSCFKHILVSGAPVEKHIIEQFQKVCNARLHLCYGMTELLVVIFKYDMDTTPFGSAGKTMSQYKYRLIDDQGDDVTEPNKSGELWVKGDAFFQGYLNNKEETKTMLTDDGWLKTGDIFYRDENDYYYFVERKRLLIRYLTYWVDNIFYYIILIQSVVSPLQLEQVIKQHPCVSDACVVGLPNPQTIEYPVAAILKKNGNTVDPQAIFDLVKRELPEVKHLHGGLFFVEGFPMTPSGKVHRTKIKEMAQAAERVFSK
ncbi:luciferin 4-monooxygenase-like [Pectinophora gossypiella]|uniref:luciferin 4-monooxygenase-like n=1 Tax=Pectinophora gossypiella TaxID=13191 RepID=UPI00214E989B|nr:luciferin 4-monooxygenase-like [Pectinophora gossypiella]